MTPEAGSPEPSPHDKADARGWPEASDCDKDGFAAELCKAKLEVRKKRTDQQIAHEKAEVDADLALEQEYYKAVLEVGKGAIDRARASADTVQKAAAAIVTLYTGVLALAFAAAETPLPGKALFAVVMLGLSILFSTAFLAYLPDAKPEPPTGDAAKVGTLGERFTNTFISWTRMAALHHSYLLRASVVALAGAAILLPAPFVTLGDRQPETQVAWPRPDPAAGDELELQKILYTAQTAEATEQRKSPIAADTGTLDALVWWGIFGMTITVIGVVFFRGRSGVAKAQSVKGAT